AGDGDVLRAGLPTAGHEDGKHTSGKATVHDGSLTPGPVVGAGAGPGITWEETRGSVDVGHLTPCHGRQGGEEVDVHAVGDDPDGAVRHGEVQAVGVAAAEAALARVVAARPRQVAAAQPARAAVHVTEDAALVGDRGLVVRRVAVGPEGAAAGQ